MTEQQLNTPINDEWVWHYTSFDNAVAILNTGIMRAYHYAFLNDRYEVRESSQLIFTQLKKIKDKAEEEYKPVLDEVILNVEKHVKYDCLGQFYLQSFCIAEDSLPMWQAYTPKSGGCAIGFLKNELKYILKYTNDKKEDNIPIFPQLTGDTLIQCQYCNLKNDDILKLLNEAFESYKIDILGKYPNMANRWFKEQIKQLIVGLKDIAFSTEKEYRLVHDWRFYNEIKFQNGKPYIELKITEPMCCKVVISPHGDTKFMEKSLLFLRTKILATSSSEYEDTTNLLPISHSKLSFQ